MATTEKNGQDKVQAELLVRLAELGGQVAGEDSIRHEGTDLVLPANMTKPQAVKFIMDVIKAEDAVTTFSQTFPYRPWDGAWAFNNVVRRHFGTMIQRAIQTMFGDKPPEQRTINTGPSGQTAQIPWGKLELPFLPGAEIYLGAAEDEEMGMVFAIRVEGPKKYKAAVQGLFNLVKQELATNSLYRGKAFDGREMPQFLDLTGVSEKNVVYSDEVLTQLDASVWSVLRYREANKKAGLPFKRAVLLSGPYGTGKTLAATLTAQVAEANGVTFIQVRPNQDNLAQAMQTARLYQPSVVFFEDVDTVGSTAEGSDHISQLLDVFDGMTSKSTEILVILTTNHPDKLYKGLLRPGRLDALIHIGALDRNGVERLARSIVPASQLGTVDWDAVYTACEGYMPAFVKEAIDRAKRYSIARNKGTLGQLETADFVQAAEGLRAQFELMEGSSDKLNAPTLDQQVAKILRANLSERTLRPESEVGR